MGSSLLQRFKFFDIPKVELLVILFLGFCYLSPIFRNEVFLSSSYFDDFFYYLKIAKNHYEGYGFSYMRGVPTNGYHPFYQYFICLLYWLSKQTGVNALIFIRIILALVFVLTSIILYRFLNPSRLITRLIFMSFVCAYYFISSNGMESVAIVPSLSVFLVYLNKRNGDIRIIIGLATLCFFWRIDSITITAPLVLYYCFKNKLFAKENFRKLITGFLIAVIPSVIYFLYNYYFFGTFFPISGLAKTVKHFSGIHKDVFRDFISVTIPINTVIYLPVLFVILSFFTRNSRDKNIAMLVSLISSFLLYFQIALRSDWIIWPWYYYPFPSLLFLCAYGYKSARFSRLNLPAYRFYCFTAATTFALLIMYCTLISFPTKPEAIMTGGKDIQRFEKMNHKGIYAMGDRAGIAGYLLESPVVQLEGLVMDKTYLQRLKQSNKLIELLRQYNVNYYIATSPVKIDDSSYVVTEPLQSSGYSYKIIDTIKWPIAYQFSKKSTYGFSGYKRTIHTIIFNVPSSK